MRYHKLYSLIRRLENEISEGRHETPLWGKFLQEARTWGVPREQVHPCIGTADPEICSSEYEAWVLAYFLMLRRELEGCEYNIEDLF